LHAAKSAAGLTVIGVPSQDFNQESADNGTVKSFCETRFGIDFPLAAVSHVRGAKAAPFYAWVNVQRSWQPS
jgi:glutathione peroxidase